MPTKQVNSPTNGTINVAPLCIDEQQSASDEIKTPSEESQNVMIGTMMAPRVLNKVHTPNGCSSLVRQINIQRRLQQIRTNTRQNRRDLRDQTLNVVSIKSQNKVMIASQTDWR